MNVQLESNLRGAVDQQKPSIDGLADLDSKFTVHGSRKLGDSSIAKPFEIEISWKDLFALVAPYLVEQPTDSTVKSRIATSLKELATGSTAGYSDSIIDQEFKTITIQFRAYGLVDTNHLQTTKGGMALFWSLTKKGERLMIESRVVREDA